MTTQLLALINSAIAFGTVIMLGALGEILIEKAGNLNLGIPGVMYLGAIGGLVAAFFYELNGGSSPVVGLILSFLCSMLFSAVGGLIYAFLTITLRANQNVTGLTLTIFGGGVANFLGGSLNKLAGGVGQISVPVTSSAYIAYTKLGYLGTVGKLLFARGFMAYLAIVLAILLSYFFNRTRTGLNLRAVGESPATADAAGISVTRYKYLSIIVGSAVAGLGGLFYTMDYIKGTWANDGTIESLGWLAVALVIFATWKPLNTIWGSYLFGFVYWAYLYIPGLTRSSLELFKMLPYAITLLVLIVVSLRKKREDQPPASLGLSYFREER
ncbi:MAG: ABC transporter permease [Oscillospiraceae bacterium]|nr:ABC transporter permease [Oscillospiraceae bacterium]